MPARPTRRQVLFGAAGTVGVAAVAATGVLLDQEVPGPSAQRVPGPRRLAPGDAVVSTEWVVSSARNRPVRLVLAVPPGADRAALPVVLGLHGLGGNALWWQDPGNRRLLGQAWGLGVPPFVLAAVDGGDNYWHPFRAGDDPRRMLLDELPGWLRARGVGTVPASGMRPGEPAEVLGISMGGAGALMYARARGQQGHPVAAVAAVSPGLFTDWRVASRRPFAGPADWEANDPLRFYPELADTPTGMWSGDRDPFVDAVRRYLVLARPEVGVVSPGRHDGPFYSRVLPDVLTFLGRHLPPPAIAALRPVGFG